MSEIKPKPLEATLYLEIISFLSQNGLLKQVSINHILDKYYTYEKYDDYSEKESAIKYFLDKMFIK